MLRSFRIASQKSRKYDTDTANVNAHLGSQLPYLLTVSRFAHYLKVMVRDKIGSFILLSDCEYFLNRWINNYVSSDDIAGQATKARYPLHEAYIDVSEVPGQPGVYRAVASLRPHFQLDELSVELRLAVELPMGVRGTVDVPSEEERQRRLPRALLSRAEQHRLQGNFEGARRDLDEAIAIAEREDVMGRDQVNSYLEYTRLSLDMGETAKARKSLETAKEIIARAGYHQWDKVVQELETQLRDEAKPGRTTRGP